MSEDLRAALDLPPIDQVGFVVRDLDQAIAAYAPLFGPFERMAPGPMDWDYRGRNEVSELELAFGRSGDLEIELIQWISGGTPHKEFVDAGREGMHHLRFIVDNVEQCIDAAAAFGYVSIWYKRFSPEQAAAYLERAGDPLLIEFYQRPDP